MWFPSVESMAAHDGASAFLALLWHEMFDPSSPDTYQPRLTHSASVAIDLQDAAARALASSRWEKHVTILQEELEGTIKTDEDVLPKMPVYQWTLLRLAKSKSFNEIVSLGKSLAANHHTYEKTAVQLFVETVDELPKRKEKVVRALRRIGTIGLRSGRDNNEFLRICTPGLLNDTPTGVAGVICSSIHQCSSLFDCILALKGEPTAVQQIARKAGFRLLSQRDIPTAPDVADFVAASTDSVCVASEESAYFAGQAVRQASRKLREASDVYNFFKNARELDVVPLALAISDKKQRSLIPLGEQAFEHLKPRKNAVNVTQNILDVRPERLSGRVLNALEHFSLAHVGAAQKVQLVNLWSAMECLVGTSKRSSVISAVVESVAPILMWRRAEKILRYMARSLQLFRAAGGIEPLGEGFTAKKSSVFAECLLLTVSKPENHPHLLALLKFCAPHPLLLNHIFALWSVFSKPEMIASELRLSQQRTSWNLWRIYRARNLIVHEGAEVPNVPILLNLLHGYFSTVLSRVLHAMNRNPNWGVDEAMAHGKARGEYLLECLNRSPRQLRVDDFFASPERRAAAPLWSV